MFGMNKTVGAVSLAASLFAAGSAHACGDNKLPAPELTVKADHDKSITLVSVRYDNILIVHGKDESGVKVFLDRPSPDTFFDSKNGAPRCPTIHFQLSNGDFSEQGRNALNALCDADQKIVPVIAKDTNVRADQAIGALYDKFCPAWAESQKPHDPAPQVAAVKKYVPGPNELVVGLNDKWAVAVQFGSIAFSVHDDRRVYFSPSSADAGSLFGAKMAFIRACDATGANEQPVRYIAQDGRLSHDANYQKMVVGVFNSEFCPSSRKGILAANGQSRSVKLLLN